MTRLGFELQTKRVGCGRYYHWVTQAGDSFQQSPINLQIQATFSVLYYKSYHITVIHRNVEWFQNEIEAGKEHNDWLDYFRLNPFQLLFLSKGVYDCLTKCQVYHRFANTHTSSDLHHFISNRICTYLYFFQLQDGVTQKCLIILDSFHTLTNAHTFLTSENNVEEAPSLSNFRCYKVTLNHKHYNNSFELTR